RLLQAHRLGPHEVGERLEATLPRDRRLRAALRLVGQIEVLELGLRARREDARAQAVAELALGRDRVEDRGPARFELRVVFVALLDLPDLHLVEPARGLLAVPRDEGDGGAA